MLLRTAEPGAVRNVKSLSFQIPVSIPLPPLTATTGRRLLPYRKHSKRPIVSVLKIDSPVTEAGRYGQRQTSRRSRLTARLRSYLEIVASGGCCGRDNSSTRIRSLLAVPSASNVTAQRFVEAIVTVRPFMSIAIISAKPNASQDYVLRCALSRCVTLSDRSSTESHYR